MVSLRGGRESSLLLHHHYSPSSLLIRGLALLPLASWSPVLGQDLGTLSCTTTSCEEVAIRTAGCNDFSDYACFCETSSYSSAFSSCLLQQTSLGCTDSDWDSLSSAIATTCTDWTSSLGSALCNECYTTGIASHGCEDEYDYGCLCADAVSATFLQELTSCAAVARSASATCPLADLASLAGYFTSSCSSFATVAASLLPGCPACQAEAASSLQCPGLEPYKCLCQGADLSSQYLASVAQCISLTSDCYSNDITAAEKSFTDACSALATGGTVPPADLAAEGSLTQSGARQTASGLNDEPEADGPDTGTVVGIVAGVVVGLALLCVAGFFIFRRRASLREKPAAIPPQRPGQPPLYGSGGYPPSNGVYELSSPPQDPSKALFAQYQHQQPPPPPPPQGGPGAFGGGGNYYELENQGNYGHNPNTHYGYTGKPSHPEGYAELGPSR